MVLTTDNVQQTFVSQMVAERYVIKHIRWILTSTMRRQFVRICSILSMSDSDYDNRFSIDSVYKYTIQCIFVNYISLFHFERIYSGANIISVFFYRI